MPVPKLVQNGFYSSFWDSGAVLGFVSVLDFFARAIRISV